MFNFYTFKIDLQDNNYRFLNSCGYIMVEYIIHEPKYKFIDKFSQFFEQQLIQSAKQEKVLRVETPSENQRK